MATAETRIVTPARAEVREVVLRLNEKEAQAIAEVLSRVGGSPTRSPRGDIDSPLRALREAGFKFTPSWDWELFANGAGHLVMRDIEPGHPWHSQNGPDEFDNDLPF